MKVATGDVIIIPAGVGHECLQAGKTFLVVGAYPPTGTYNECFGSFQERDRARARQSPGSLIVPHLYRKNPMAFDDTSTEQYL